MLDKLPVSVDIGGLTEPVTKLIEAVHDFIGMRYEPTRILRDAQAKAEAARILAEAEVDAERIRTLGHFETEEEIRERVARAIKRQNYLELRRQNNIESIVVKAAHQLPDSVSSEEVDEDWIAQFFIRCQDVSNDKMQEIWARLLAGEVAEPGSYSPRTLHLVQMLRQSEAELFESASNYVWNGCYIFHSPETDELMGSGVLYYARFLHLQHLGLVDADATLGVKLAKGDTVEFQYFQKVHRLTNPGYPSVLPAYVLTKSALELLPLCTPEPDEEYRAALVESWTKAGIEVQISGSDE